MDSLLFFPNNGAFLCKSMCNLEERNMIAINFVKTFIEILFFI